MEASAKAAEMEVYAKAEAKRLERNRKARERYANKKAAEAYAHHQAQVAAGFTLCTCCCDWFRAAPWDDSVLCHGCYIKKQVRLATALGIPLTVDGHDNKCALCNSRFPDLKQEDGSWIHADCA